MAKSVEAQHVIDTENVRVFITNGPFTAGSYYSHDDGEYKMATASLNLKMHTVTVAFKDGGHPGKSAREIVQGLWGPKAGGKDGIAGSPRGTEMGAKDLVDAVLRLEEIFHAPADPADVHTEAYRRELEDKFYCMGLDLKRAINESILERGLPLEPAKLDPDEMDSLVWNETRGLTGKDLEDKAFHLYEIYGKDAIRYIDVSAYEREGDYDSPSAAPTISLDRKYGGFVIQHTVQIFDEDEKDSIQTYTLPEETVIFTRQTEKERKRAEEIEEQNVFDTDHVRVFITDGPSTEFCFYSPVDEETKAATVTLDMRTKDITLMASDAVGNMDAGAFTRDTAKSLWGSGAGEWSPMGGASAISPRGREMGAKDLVDAVMKLEQTIAQPLSMDKVAELREMRGELTQAVNEDIRDRGLALRPIGDTLEKNAPAK